MPALGERLRHFEHIGVGSSTVRFGKHVDRIRCNGYSRLALAALCLLLIFMAWIIWGREWDYIALLANWLNDHPLGAPLVFIVAHVVTAAAFLPCSPFTLLAGLLWPLPYSLLISTTAALLASSTTFLLGRYLYPRELRSRHLKSGVGQRLMAIADEHKWKLVALAHINPALPSSTLGYLFGMSKISLRLYVLTAFLGMLPLQIALVGMGNAVRDALLSRPWMITGASLMLSVAAIGAWAALKRIAAKVDKRKREGNE
jgi:uncharacterized membrane protein YdjX (TVP38/TMEM64 family)